MAGDERSFAGTRGRAAKLARYEYSSSSEISLGGRGGAAVFYSRREVGPFRVKRFTFHDIKELLLLGFYLGVAAIVPARHWNRICGFASQLRVRRHRRKIFATLKRDLEAIAPASDPEAFFREYLTALHRQRLYYMAQLAGWHWKPRIIVEGAEHITRAAARGRGVLVWCAWLPAQVLIGKRALHEAGIRACQVNARQHGLSTTAFGQRVINPILLGIENRFLKGRIPFDSSESVHVARRMLEALRANAVVLVAVNTYSGRRFVQVPIGHSGYAHFATAPANFAAKGRTTLLGMSTVETVPFAELRAVIRPLPEQQDAKSIGGDPAIAEVVAAFRDAFEDVVLSFPGQCLGFGRDLVGQPIEERPGFMVGQGRIPKSRGTISGSPGPRAET
jgi:lauroyl/myristoyl acyltransferase